MKIVRYTFDVCLRDSTDRDTYDMARKLEEGILKVENVCGCEVVKDSFNRFNQVSVNDAIRSQHSLRKNIEET